MGDTKESKFVTLWIALSNATTNNSCLYVIPKKYDPGYINGDNNDNNDDGEEECCPLRRALPNKQSYQHIRALPRKSGQSILFTHRLIHWGSSRDQYDDDDDNNFDNDDDDDDKSYSS